MSTMTGNDLGLKTRLGKSLLAVVLVTVAILMIPLVAMQFTTEVNWTALDFVAAGILLSLTGLTLVLALRKLSTLTSRLIVIGLIGLGFLYCWAEMAVGVLTTLGS